MVNLEFELSFLPFLGTTKPKHLDEDIGALRVKLTEEDLKEITDAVPVNEVAGCRMFDAYYRATYKFADTPLPKISKWFLLNPFDGGMQGAFDISAEKMNFLLCFLSCSMFSICRLMLCWMNYKSEWKRPKLNPLFVFLNFLGVLII